MSRSKKIFEDWNILCKILERHEDLLRKRWIKRTKEQRKKIFSLLDQTCRPIIDQISRHFTDTR